MLGYEKYNDIEDNIFITFLWSLLAGVLFVIYLVYASFTTMYSLDGELIGQAKKLTLVTPLWSSVCPIYYALDVSMGVLQGGTGSMSSQDVWFTVKDTADLQMMREAVAAARIVKVRYDERRLAACTETHLATGFEVAR